MYSNNEWWLWLGFFIFIFLVLLIDIFLLGGKKAHRVSLKESLGWVIVWVIFSLIFNFLLWYYLSRNVGYDIANEKALEFFTGYLIELSLSVDNMFVFITIFNYFSVPFEYQRRVLLYGILSAILMRLILILLGVFLVSKFHGILYLFGIFLAYTGIKMLVVKNVLPNPETNRVLYFIRRHLRVVDTFVEEKFFLRIDNKIYATPLFLVLLAIETCDLIFALDSIPAIFAITEDPLIIFTSNIFAILGLRAMYFVLAHMNTRIEYLKHGIAFILIFIGIKMLIGYWFKLPVFIALGVIFAILITSIVLSIIKKRFTKI